MADNTFLTKQQEQRVIDAIAEAENKTSGELRVHLEDHCKKNPLKRAVHIFKKLGMSQTERQNGVVIYIAVEDRKAAVFGGKGINSRVDENYWYDVLNIIITHFKKSEFEQGLAKAVNKVGNKLKEIYPVQTDDVNELSDEISYGDKTWIVKRRVIINLYYCNLKW